MNNIIEARVRERGNSDSKHRKAESTEQNGMHTQFENTASSTVSVCACANSVRPIKKQTLTN